MSARRGFWLALDGLDCAGKTTQTLLVSEALRLRGEQVLIVPEFSNGPLGSMIARIIEAQQYLSLDSNGRTRGADTLALLADFIYKIEEGAVRAHLGAGGVVVSDRGLMSLISYQAVRVAGTTGEPVETALKWLMDLLALALQRYPQPDLHILLQLPVKLIDSRLASRGEMPLDVKAQCFMQKAGDLMCLLFKQNTYPSEMIDASRSPSEVLAENLALLIRRRSEAKL